MIFRQILMIFQYFWTLGANYYAEIRLQGLTISGANYSEPPLADAAAPSAERGAGAQRRHTFVLQLGITTPHYGHLILQMAVYAL